MACSPVTTAVSSMKQASGQSSPEGRNSTRAPSRRIVATYASCCAHARETSMDAVFSLRTHRAYCGETARAMTRGRGGEGEHGEEVSVPEGAGNEEERAPGLHAASNMIDMRSRAVSTPRAPHARAPRRFPRTAPPDPSPPAGGRVCTSCARWRPSSRSRCSSTHRQGFCRPRPARAEGVLTWPSPVPAPPHRHDVEIPGDDRVPRSLLREQRPRPHRPPTKPPCEGINPFDHGIKKYTTALKTQALKAR